MTFGLSFLDKSPIHQDESAVAALRRTVTLAQKAEAHGFTRFWVAEHHNSPKLAFTRAVASSKEAAGG